MRLHALFSLLFSVALLALGCGKNGSPTTPPNPKITDAKNKISDAEKASVEAARAKRDEYAPRHAEAAGRTDREVRRV